MFMHQAIEKALLEQDNPIVTDYDFYCVGLQIYRKREWAGEAIKRLPEQWDHQRARNALNQLISRRVLTSDDDFRSGVWRVIQSTRGGSAEEIACIVDPFCYVSHISAMQRYGFTDRSPDAVHLTTPARLVWNSMRNEKVTQELGENIRLSHPPLLRLGFKDRVRRRQIVVHEDSHPATPVAIRGERTRITSVGRTFVDMISEPALCGGMRHAISAWKEHGRTWIDEIINSVDKNDSKIIKVRAGFIISEILHIDDARINLWSRFAQRGGSRKLDPDAPYSPNFSSRWMISINV